MAQLAVLIPDMRGGGAERVALTLIQGLIDEGHDVDLILLQAAGELLPLVPGNVRIVHLEADRFRQAVTPLKRYLRSRQPVGLIAMMWPMPIIAVIARYLAGSSARIIASDHAILSEHYRNLPAKLAALRLTTRIFYPLAERRVGASTQIADDLARISGLPRRKFDVIHNPIEMPSGAIAPGPEVEALWRGEGLRVLSVGSLKPEKNFEMLLRAFAQLRERRNASLMILGEGEDRLKLEAMADRLGVGDHVSLPGFRTDPWPYYASADLFALTSTTEGFGNVLVEAMAVGLPVISTDCAGPREVLADGRFGKLIPIGDTNALLEAMVESADGCADRDALRARAREFRPEIALGSYLGLLLDRPKTS